MPPENGHSERIDLTAAVLQKFPAGVPQGQGLPMHRNPTVPRTQHSQNSLGEGAAHNSPRDSPIREPESQDSEVPTSHCSGTLFPLVAMGVVANTIPRSKSALGSTQHSSIALHWSPIAQDTMPRSPTARPFIPRCCPRFQSDVSLHPGPPVMTGPLRRGLP